MASSHIVNKPYVSSSQVQSCATLSEHCQYTTNDLIRLDSTTVLLEDEKQNMVQDTQLWTWFLKAAWDHPFIHQSTYWYVLVHTTPII